MNNNKRHSADWFTFSAIPHFDFDFRNAEKNREKPRKVTGTVLKIVRGKLTDQRLTAEEAFNDSEQAMEQVIYAERYGSS